MTQVHARSHAQGNALDPPSLVLVVLAIIAVYILGCAPVAETQTAVEVTSQRAELPTLDDFWEQKARFELEVADTGLPMGESDTVILPDGTWRSYVHASHPSLGVVDQCGAPVEFPGCLINFTSANQGRTFTPTLSASGAPVCQIACVRCPCDSRRDHIDQQQYPRVAWLREAAKAHSSKQNEQWLLTYEYRANTFLRRSSDGLTWSRPVEVPLTGIWRAWLMPCRPEAAIGPHPFAPATYDCLVGSPPGIFIDDAAIPPQLYIFVGVGQNGSGMGCYRGPLAGPAALMHACNHNPLFTGAQTYGAPDKAASPAANAFFDFRTISSADLLTLGERHYLFYEGVRGPGAGDHGDTQFLLGLARSTSTAIDGAWELYPGNPILMDLPGNVGVGHADVVMANGATYLYTSLDGATRSRLRLVWE